MRRAAILALRDYAFQKRQSNNPVLHAGDIGMDETPMHFWK